MSQVSINPYTGEKYSEFQEDSPEAVLHKIDIAQNAFLSWKTTPIPQRITFLNALAQILEEKKFEYAEIITKEMGKPIKQSIAEVEKCKLICEYYANNSEKFLADEIVETEAKKSYVTFEPLGIILTVMPWNFPFWQAIRSIVPKVIAGNTVLLKHASNVPTIAVTIEKAFVSAGFPAGVFQTLLIGSDRVESVIRHKNVKAVSLTGSEFAGKTVASQAASEIKKSVLELGGSDAFIILDDADIDLAVKSAGKARLDNAGQSCVSAKRMIVVESKYDEYISKLKETFMSKKLGDPMLMETEVGPMVSIKAIEEIERQIEESVSLGAKIELGGTRGDTGCMFMPTILTNVTPGMPAYSEELFGPVATIIKAQNNDDAIRIANDTDFGLGASLWTTSEANIQKYVPMIEAGNVRVNSIVRSDPRLPFGGIKKSGFGRELSRYSMLEFVNVKSVWNN